MKNKKKSKKKKKGTSHSDETNNPNLSKALLSMNADDQMKAIKEPTSRAGTCYCGT